MDHYIRFSFALTPRMHAFIELRNALQCIHAAQQKQDAYGWLQAVYDLQESLFGSAARKPVIPELVGVMQAIRSRLTALATQHHMFKKPMLQACDALMEHENKLTTAIPELLHFLAEDGLIQAWVNCQKKQDWLAHRRFYPCTLSTVWQTLGMHEALAEQLKVLHTAALHVDAMLNDFVLWKEMMATHGYDQVIPSSRDESYGLLIVGLEPQWVQRGIIPEFSGNKHAVRIRFQQWHVGEEQRPFDQNIPYQRMLVPIE